MESKIKEIVSRGKVRNKKDCYLLYQRGFFGNKPKTWNSYSEIKKDGWEGSVSMRSISGTKRGNVKYGVPVSEISQNIQDLKKRGVAAKEITYNESMPDEYLKIQGEIARTPSGLYLFYSDLPKPMNIALAQDPKIAQGLCAKMLLERNLDPSSVSNIERLLDIFPNDVVEFSTWGKQVGNFAEDTIVWEVRNY